MISTERFYLRKYIMDDAQSMFNNWASDKEVTKYLTWNHHENVEVTKAFISFVINTNQSDYVIVCKENDEIIGSISNVGENADFSICEIGYCLSRKYWNQGVMTEVLDAYLNELFNHRNYQAVEAEHMVENIASGKVMMKCGFRYNYTVDKLVNKHGWISVKHYSITKEEYQMHKLQQTLNNFLNANVPMLATVDKTMHVMSNNGFLVKKINLIDDGNLVIKKSDDVLVIHNQEQNIITCYLIGKNNSKKVFEDYVKSFLLDNQKSFISFDNETIEQLLVKLLKKNNLTISFAESCSGGLMASTVINVSGASDVIKESYVTYSDEAKHKILNVKNKTIEQYSVYSKEVAVEMAKGLSFISKANICVSITGLAGGSTPNSNDGTYDACIIINYNSKEYIISFRKKEVGKRNDVRKRQVNYVFYRVIRALKDIL